MKVRKIISTAGCLIVTMAASVNAQPPDIHRHMWTGGNTVSESNQALLQWSNPHVDSDDQDVRYSVVPIGVLPGKTASFLTGVRGVNNLEHVTGYSFVLTGNLFLTGQGFLWQDGQLKALPLLHGWPAAFAFGINDRDQVVGTANNVDGSGLILQTAVLWEHEQPIDLGALHPGWNAYASDINLWGVIVGASAPVIAQNTGPATPVVWSGGTVQALPLLPGETGGSANEINALGVIIGVQTSATNTIPCLWYWNGTGFTAVNLGSLGGNSGEAFGINNFTQVTGYSLSAGNHAQPFRWDPQRGLQPLPLLPPETDCNAFNLNNLGQIVGNCNVFDSKGNVVSSRSVIWENGTVLDLQTLVPKGTLPLTYEMGNINDLGEITVNAMNPDGSPAALLLVPKRN